MTEISLDRVAEALGYTEKKPSDGHEYATVSSINSDGSYQVLFDGASSTARATRLCYAKAGDRVLCLISNGKVSAIGAVGNGGVPKVLYDNAFGSSGTIQLSESAANFNYMRIYYKKKNDSNSYSSVDVYKPDGKIVSLSLINPYDSSHVQFVGRAVSISGTTISDYRLEGYMNTTWQTTDTITVDITRVEAWSGGASIGVGGGSGGGGGGGGDGDKNYTFVQSTDAFIWNITHNLGKNPSVTVVDSGGNIIEGAVNYIDSNNVQVQFNVETRGVAYCN